MKLYGLFIVLLTSSSVFAKTKLIENDKPYNINVEQLQNIFNKIIEDPEVQIDDQLFHGGQTWKSTWKFSVRGHGRKCRLKNLKMQLAIRYPLPTLDKPLANPSEQKAWEQYQDALKKHQLGHKKIALEITETVQTELKAIRGFRSCDELEKLTWEHGSEAFKNYQIKHEEYDTKTRFGVTQGADLKRYLNPH
ncbi:DUF922 domain-containing Zn-dependent protease [Psychrosphaera sp. B3R10]|uniref:DUF922 domain-containing protein n=1 Tax=Psychrosphaera algicola TaxID=3023714 RepID=A0ABT5FF05_9GAMM|nr:MULTISPECIES: DUF922 domain-containing protein [unclassified Psychrosphaera]MBU2883814.1 DUF922 domain-containing Zn-dependent protease [Psychrosphaera sp. I2R16]MBU2990197.1 DUF922 domain-containing Zn-dependent protease [Psychrosphaera sp. B3R10]MDC2889916.1 DUF922 domain-containing protein [Psychrosphaera sp. G1-22]